MKPTLLSIAMLAAVGCQQSESDAQKLKTSGDQKANFAQAATTIVATLSYKFSIWNKADELEDRRTVVLYRGSKNARAIFDQGIPEQGNSGQGISQEGPGEEFLPGTELDDDFGSEEGGGNPGFDEEDLGNGAENPPIPGTETDDEDVGCDRNKFGSCGDSGTPLGLEFDLNQDVLSAATRDANLKSKTLYVSFLAEAAGDLNIGINETHGDREISRLWLPASDLSSGAMRVTPYAFEVTKNGKTYVYKSLVYLSVERQ
jgi:hypothetical protein